MTANRPDATFLTDPSPKTNTLTRRALAKSGRNVDRLSDDQVARLFAALPAPTRQQCLDAAEKDIPAAKPPTGKRK